MKKTENNKIKIRNKILKLRLGMDNKMIKTNSKIICEKIKSINKYSTSKNILIYFPIKNEVDLLSLTEDKNKTFYLPISKETKLGFGIFDNKFSLIAGKFGILEPKEKHKETKFDIIILPGIAFDKEKNRIGYGKGYYDNFLKSLDYKTLILGVAFDLQIIEKIIPSKNDQKADIIITEKNIF